MGAPQIGENIEMAFLKKARSGVKLTKMIKWLKVAKMNNRKAGGNTASSSRHLFHYAPFRNLFFVRLLTVLGNGIAPIALAFAVLDIGGSATDLVWQRRALV